MRLKTLTILDCVCLKTIRFMAKNFQEPDHCRKRTLQTARACVIDDLETLKTTIATFDNEETQRKENLTSHPTSSSTQPITIVREDNSSWLTKPFQSFTVTATSTWSEIISNMSKSFLNPHTAIFGEALRNSDYFKFKSLLEDLEKSMDPKTYGPFMTTIKSFICNHLCAFKPQVNRNTTIDLPFYDFLMYWKDIHAGDRAINTRLRENVHAQLVQFHIVECEIL